MPPTWPIGLLASAPAFSSAPAATVSSCSTAVFSGVQCNGNGVQPASSALAPAPRSTSITDTWPSIIAKMSGV